jgi:hypothetical protein
MIRSRRARLWTYVRDDRHFVGRDPLATAFYSPIAAPSTRGSFSATSASGRSLESKDIWFGVDRRLGSVTDRRPARISHSLRNATLFISRVHASSLMDATDL